MWNFMSVATESLSMSCNKRYIIYLKKTFNQNCTCSVGSAQCSGCVVYGPGGYGCHLSVIINQNCMCMLLQ